jgi:hypothetical protein
LKVQKIGVDVSDVDGWQPCEAVMGRSASADEAVADGESGSTAETGADTVARTAGAADTAAVVVDSMPWWPIAALQHEYQPQCAVQQSANSVEWKKRMGETVQWHMKSPEFVEVERMQMPISEHRLH